MRDFFKTVIIIFLICIVLSYWGNEESFRDGLVELGQDTISIIDEINTPKER